MSHGRPSGWPGLLHSPLPRSDPLRMSDRPPVHTNACQTCNTACCHGPMHAASYSVVLSGPSASRKDLHLTPRAAAAAKQYACLGQMLASCKELHMLMVKQ